MKTKQTSLFIALLLYGIILTFVSSCKKDNDNDNNTVKDIDGNVYHTVTIGTQVWLVEDLAVTHYRNGDEIPNKVDNEWDNASTGACCDYDNSPNSDYGKLYNERALSDNRGICPSGWHIPTDTEWNTLISYLGGNDIAGSKLKESGTEHWNSPNDDATNSSGFTARPGGYRPYYNHAFYSRGKYGMWWSYEGNALTLQYDEASVIVGNSIGSGLSVRCIKD